MLKSTRTSPFGAPASGKTKTATSPFRPGKTSGLAAVGAVDLLVGCASTATKDAKVAWLRHAISVLQGMAGAQDVLASKLSELEVLGVS